MSHNSHEVRAGSTSMGPHALRSWQPLHDLTDFDLMVIMQVAGCEAQAASLLSGSSSFSEKDLENLTIANDLAKQKGYTDLFEFAVDGPQVSWDARQALTHLFASNVWKERDQSKTRGTGE
jgi:hypothetical protein